MLRFLSLGGLALAAECGPTDLTLVTDGYFPAEARVTLSQEIKSKHFDIVYGHGSKWSAAEGAGVLLFHGSYLIQSNVLL